VLERFVKIALVTDWYEPRIGGIELHLRDLAARLAARGHEVTVVTPTPGDTAVDGIQVHRVDAPRAPAFGFLYTPDGIRALGQSLEEIGADVAHCHVSIVSPAALGGAAHAQRLRIPTVLTFHSVVPRTGLLAASARVVLRTDCWNCIFTAVSARVARDVQPIARARPIALLPNGIDCAFWQTGSERDGDRVELLSVMRLNAKKRPHVLLDVMRSLRSASPRSTRLRIVGDGPLRTRLEREVQRARLSDSVELLGHRTRAEISALLAESHVFVLPTLRESFGLAALEAACAGVPVVAMRASGVSEFIEHGVNGLLASSDRELASHVAILVDDATQRRRLALADRAPLARFDWPAVIDAHLATYREAIALRAKV
jgi:glycosyltransferase involved in cell wall biosynthesis